jgi:hypothetical protein
VAEDLKQPVSDVQAAPPGTGPKKPTPRKWQERLLPVMAGLLIGLTVFFFGATFVQMSYLHSSMLQIPAIDLQSLPDSGLLTAAGTFEEQATARRLEILAKLESYLIERRYHQASALLMSGLWLRYLGFVTGMILALVGASFVLGKLQEPTSEIAGKSTLIDFSVKSASPGLLLAVLGSLLMFATIVDRDDYAVVDVSTYLSGANPSASRAVEPGLLPPLEIYETPTPGAPKSTSPVVP